MLALVLLSAYVAKHVNGDPLVQQQWPTHPPPAAFTHVATTADPSRRRRSTPTDPSRRRRSTPTEGPPTEAPKGGLAHQIPGILIGTGVGVAGAVAAGTGVAVAMAHSHSTATPVWTPWTTQTTLSPSVPQTTVSPFFTASPQSFPQSTAPVTMTFQTFAPSTSVRLREKEDNSSSFAAALLIPALLCLCCIGLLGFLAFHHSKTKKASRRKERPHAEPPVVHPEPVQEQAPLMGHWEQPMGHWEQPKQVVKVTAPSHVPEVVSWAPQVAATTMPASYVPAATTLPASYTPATTTMPASSYTPIAGTMPAASYTPMYSPAPAQIL